ncbi:MAG TPA: caspase family protein [Pyrinomonadaceae bacterium]|nr:caspase family protein [Pyrinomonadaceae bacterium]
MKKALTPWRMDLQFWQFALTILISVCAHTGVAQTAAPTPPDKRGLGIENSSPTSQSDQTKAKEAKPELVLQTGYNNFFGATQLVFSPDGRLLATATFRSSTIKLWETATGRELRNISTGGQNAMSMSTVFAFSPDSRLLAAAAGSNSVKVYDVITGREVQTLTGGQASFMASFGVTFIAFSADGKKLVTVSDAIKVWDVASWRELKTQEATSLNASSFMGGKGGMALSPDGNQLARVADAGKAEIRFLDLTTGREARSVSLPHARIDSLELCFAADGHLVAAGIVEKKLKTWDVTTKQTERDLAPTAQEYSLIKFSRDGRLLALSEGYTIKLWDLVAGRELPTLNVPNLGVFTQTGGVFAGFSDDGKKVATSGFGTSTLLWETETGKQLLPMKGRSNMAYAVAFSADGTQLSAGGRTRWDLRAGRGLRVTPAPSDKLFGIPGPDGKQIAMFAPNNNTITILETTSGRQLQTLTRATTGGGVERVTFSPDGHLLAVRYMEDQESQGPRTIGGLPSSQVKIWDVTSGREVQTLTLATAPNEVGFTADGRELLTVTGQGEVVLWDIASGNRLRSFAATAPAASPGSFPNPGSLPNLGSLPKMKPGSMPTMPTNMPTSMADVSAMITNVLGTMTAGTMGKNVTSVAFSPDGRTLATGGVESKSNLDMATLMSTSKKNSKNKQSSDPQDFLKDLKVETVGQVLLFDVATGREVGAIKGHGKGVTNVAFSRDGKLLASSSTDNTIKIWDLASNRELRTLVGHTANVESMDFSPDGRLLASAGDDGSTYLWDANTGEHLLTLVSLDDGGEWIVVTPEGLFDGTPAAWNQILWRYNQDTFNVAPIEWFFNEFYYPGLLGDVFAGKRPHVAQDVSKKDRRQPIVKLSLAGEPAPASGIAARNVKVRIEITDAVADKDHSQGSGARDVRLFRNGSLVKVWHGDALKGQTAATMEEEITLVAGPNRLTAYAFNNDNVKSKDANLMLTGADSLKRAGTAWIIAVGLNEYANAQYNLKYAVADAQSFAEELRHQQAQIGRFDRVEVISLLNENATKENILSALQRLAGMAGTRPPSLKAGPLDRLKRAEPEDAVIIYFAGHGTAQGQRFYLIPHDLGYTGGRGELDEGGLKTILSHSISDQELEESVEGLAAGSLLMVIDACNSGQALEAEEKRRGPMNSKGLAQLAYEKGMYILTAAQSYQAALEAAQFGHGLLTYVLVEEGLKTAAADNEPKDGVISAREWLDFATERVPQMQEEKMKQARGLGLDIAFTEGEKNIADPEQRTLQRPRMFYRREMETDPLVIAKPGAKP